MHTCGSRCCSQFTHLSTMLFNQPENLQSKLVLPPSPAFAPFLCLPSVTPVLQHLAVPGPQLPYILFTRAHPCSKGSLSSFPRFLGKKKSNYSRIGFGLLNWGKQWQWGLPLSPRANAAGMKEAGRAEGRPRNHVHGPQKEQGKVNHSEPWDPSTPLSFWDLRTVVGNREKSFPSSCRTVLPAPP